jgi:ABC-2 type transport system ATP-binding protein
MHGPAISIRQLSHFYRARQALAEVSLEVGRGELFALLGPNGGGKTTLFRILSTLVPIQQGKVRILEHGLPADVGAIRAAIGVVFQAPSVDKKLTVEENVFQQAALYGLSQNRCRTHCAELLTRFGLWERRRERTETLSGGLRRRVELAKGLIHLPRLLLLDEPSTGLDPGARHELWTYLVQLRDDFGVTVMLTTHLLEEAAKADRIAILDRGSLVAVGQPDALCAELGGDSIAIESNAPEALAEAIRQQFQFAATVVDGTVRLEQPDGHAWVPRLVEAFPGRIEAIRLGRPSLEDVFIRRTGHRFWPQREGKNNSMGESADAS